MYNKYKDKYIMYPNFGDKDKTVLSCFCLFDDIFTESFINDLIRRNIMCRKYYNPLKDTECAKRMYDKILCYPLNLDIDEILFI
jgi:hypothetical protein